MSVSRTGRDPLGPSIVGLPRRRAHDVLDAEQALRNLVAGDLRTAVVLDLLQRRLDALPELHDRRDALAPARVGHTDHRAVEYGGVRLDRGLDLFGEDLLAAGVDRHRAAAEERDASVGLDHGVVARHRVAHAVVDDERLGRLLRVLVVLERDVTGPRDLADHLGARLDRLSIVVEDDGHADLRHGRAALHLGLAGLHHHHAVVAAL